ncbi:hypothetical protein GQ42DRAFT_161703 [Ramicandelaber brevisporus]|nr:hypothetical protein GQ42DRAFT_161703 [Ramicandelaber brevisporus]
MKATFVISLVLAMVFMASMVYSEPQPAFFSHVVRQPRAHLSLPTPMPNKLKKPYSSSSRPITMPNKLKRPYNKFKKPKKPFRICKALSCAFNYKRKPKTSPTALARIGTTVTGGGSGSGLPAAAAPPPTAAATVAQV